MATAYSVILVIAAIGMAVGWRMTPARAGGRSEGLPRLLQIGIAGTALIVCMLLLIPWLEALPKATCSEEDLAKGRCVAGLREQALFGSAIFAMLAGTGLAFVARKGVFDVGRAGELALAPEPKQVQPKQAEAPAPTPEAKREEPKREEPKREEPKPAAKREEPKPEIEREPPKPQPTASEAALSAPTVVEGPPAKPIREPSGGAWRRLSGPVFEAFVDGDVATIDEAMRAAAARIRSDHIAVVFSRGASKEANEALLELAEVLGAHRYVLEGTEAANDGLRLADRPDPHDVDVIAGPDARHAGELALEMAGSLIQTVMLLDTRVAFPVFVLGKLTEIQSVCIAHAHDSVSAACQVLLPGTNPGEREGELSPSEGQTNHRRPREWYVRQLIEILRAESVPPSSGEPADSAVERPPAES